ncbi:UNKNOWN [Stylonychia lemnae]|uniref:Uncharacterized protein n=1 Tax=Stylonychia lemnae TaxID=5949 RepID=A0A078B363_STYLE|nr:UNKNOWN [Stylonychia lemnae]|eukprot:CDW88960.1 UNKNOWN [Stylonychia lemnae]
MQSTSYSMITNKPKKNTISTPKFSVLQSKLALQIKAAEAKHTSLDREEYGDGANFLYKVEGGKLDIACNKSAVKENKKRKQNIDHYVSNIGKESDAIIEEIEEKIKQLDELANDNIKIDYEKDVEEIKIKKILEKERALFNHTGGSELNTPKSNNDIKDSDEIPRLNIHHTETPFFGDKSMSKKRTSMNYTLTASNALNQSIANSPKNNYNSPYDISHKPSFSIRKHSINSGIGQSYNSSLIKDPSTLKFPSLINQRRAYQGGSPTKRNRVNQSYKTQTQSNGHVSNMLHPFSDPAEQSLKQLHMPDISSKLKTIQQTQSVPISPKASNVKIDDTGSDIHKLYKMENQFDQRFTVKDYSLEYIRMISQESGLMKELIENFSPQSFMKEPRLKRGDSLKKSLNPDQQVGEFSIKAFMLQDSLSPKKSSPKNFQDVITSMTQSQQSRPKFDTKRYSISLPQSPKFQDDRSKLSKKLQTPMYHHNNQNLATFSIEPKDMVEDQSIVHEEEEESPQKVLESQETFISPLELENAPVFKDYEQSRTRYNTNVISQQNNHYFQENKKNWDQEIYYVIKEYQNSLNAVEKNDARFQQNKQQDSRKNSQNIPQNINSIRSSSNTVNESMNSAGIFTKQHDNIMQFLKKMEKQHFHKEFMKYEKKSNNFKQNSASMKNTRESSINNAGNSLDHNQSLNFGDQSNLEKQGGQRLADIRERIKNYGKWYINPDKFNRNFDIMRQVITSRQKQEQLVQRIQMVKKSSFKEIDMSQILDPLGQKDSLNVSLNDFQVPIDPSGPRSTNNSSVKQETNGFSNNAKSKDGKSQHVEIKKKHISKQQVEMEILKNLEQLASSLKHHKEDYDDDFINMDG